MNIECELKKDGERHAALLSTLGNAHKIELDSKEGGAGCRANGGELLCLSIASCFCNDIYRESVSFGIEVESVRVKVTAEFGGVGEAAKSISYFPTVEARASEAEIEALIIHTDKVAEIHNTLRQGMPVKLTSIHAESM